MRMKSAGRKTSIPKIRTATAMKRQLGFVAPKSKLLIGMRDGARCLPKAFLNEKDLASSHKWKRTLIES
jgi:hypothetical protein